MQILRPLSTGELFDQIFTLYRRHFLLFLFIALVPQVIETLITDTAFLMPSTGKDPSVEAVLIGLLGRTVGFCVTAVSQGATVYAVSQLYLDQPISGASAYSYVRPLWLRLIVVQIGFSIYVGIGTLLLIVPGIYFAIVYALATNVTAIEDLTFREAMDRSKFLMKGNGARVVLIFLLSLVVSIILAFCLGLGAEYTVPVLGRFLPDAKVILDQLTDILGVSLATPIALIGFTLVYYDARVRKEAFDLHHVIDTELLASADAAGEGL
jgi:hypothetical protein